MPPLPTIAVLSRHRHPRLRYVLKELGRDLGWHFRLMTDRDKWEKLVVDAKVTYGENSGGVKSKHWPAHPYLSGAAAGTADYEVEHRDGLPVFFATAGGPDLLAAIFFQLSRAEEYEAFKADAHGRFPASESHALRNGYLGRPVVREWAAALAAGLMAEFPDLPEPVVPPFRFRPSYDIDLLWAWKYRGWRGLAAGLRDVLTGHPRRAWQRFTTSGNDDPYNTLAWLEELHASSQPPLAPIYFWLLANNTDRRDPNPYPVPAEQIEVMREIAVKHQVGIHPSYRSSDQPELIAKEAARLAVVTGRAARHSRQHFLRFRLPDTYRSLRDAGITHDYSMGYADGVGWRAGTNLPFFWYDLEREEATGLLVHPFAAMDVTLKNYLGLGPEDAQQEVVKLAELVKPFGGAFMLLWHNSSFAGGYGWKEWREGYREMINLLSGSK